MTDINQMVEDWHNGAGEGLELHEYLGMSWEEFKEELGITPEEMEAATEWFKSWIAEQKDIGTEYEQALMDNLDDLYEG